MNVVDDMKKSGKILCIAAVSLIVSFSFPGYSTGQEGDERILHFHSDVTVHRDGSMTVTESIKVRAHGDRIKRGIYRDFPTVYPGKYGFVTRTGFSVKTVLRDGRPDEYRIESLSNGKRVYIGKKDYLLPAGVYQYRITYRTDYQLGLYKEYDELYWNVTGNGWVFPIDRATLQVSLHGGAAVKIFATEGFTGPSGAADKNYNARTDPRGTIHYNTTKPLGPEEGLTVRIRWEKGFVVAPDTAMKRQKFARDNIGMFIGASGLVVVFFYYLICWFIAGRDPRRGTVIPRYSPPENLSPASIRFVSRMGFDFRTFASALVNMAVKGHLTIDEDDEGEYTLGRNDQNKVHLSPEEKKISGKLFDGSGSVTLKPGEHRKISGAVRAARTALKLNYEKKYFLKNLGYFVPGIALSAVAVVSSIVSGIMLSPEMFLIVWLTFWSVGVYFLISLVIRSWRDAAGRKGHRIMRTGQALFFTLFSIPFIIAEIAALVIYLMTGPIPMLLIPLFMVLINFLFYRLLKAPTRAGRKLMDDIEGFKMFLNVAEKDRLNRLNPPEKNPETFERFLPYAIALDLDNQWGEYFADTLSDVRARGTGYTPSWYHGGSWSSLGTGAFVSSLGGTLGGAIAASSSSPGSGSGGGGGSSGGGGGGGGGGGW